MKRIQILIETYCEHCKINFIDESGNWIELFCKRCGKPIKKFAIHPISIS